MKKLTAILLIVVSFSGFSQTEKGDWIITPVVGRSSIYSGSSEENSNYLNISLPVYFHHYLSDRFAIGWKATLYYNWFEHTPVDVNDFYRKTTQIGIRLIPSIRYNILKTRLTPFIEATYLGAINFDYRTMQSENPIIPINKRTASVFDFSQEAYITNVYFDIGVSYFIKDKFALQVYLSEVGHNLSRGVYANLSPLNFGLQFVINR
jgi:hypothetical protein